MIKHHKAQHLIPSPKPNHQSLTICTQNCLWGNNLSNILFPSKRHQRFQPLIENIKTKHDPDILFLQEILWTKDIPIIQEILNDYEALYIRVQRSIKTLIPNVMGGLVTMVKKDLEPRHTRFNKYKKQGRFFHPQFFEALLRKGILSTLIPIRDRLITLSNTHLVSIPNAEELHKRAHRDKALISQLRQISEHMRETPDLICGGDFNICTSDPPFKRYIRKISSIIHITGALKEPTCGEFGVIDHIYASRSITHEPSSKQQGYINNNGESDHRGIYSIIPICIDGTKISCRKDIAGIADQFYLPISA